MAGEEGGSLERNGRGGGRAPKKRGARGRGGGKRQRDRERQG